MESSAKDRREGQEGRRQAPPAATLPSACGQLGSHCRPTCLSAYLSCKAPCLVCRDGQACRWWTSLRGGVTHTNPQGSLGRNRLPPGLFQEWRQEGKEW